MRPLRLDTAAVTDKGPRRSRNEDRFLVRELADGSVLLLVADGMGGESGGDVAAQVVVDILARFPGADGKGHEPLVAALHEADDRIRALADEDPEHEGMGTTATVVLYGQGSAHWAHVGDSRLYHLHRGRLRQVTTDHRFIQEFLDDGSLTPEQAATHPFRNVLEQCVGCSEVSPDGGSFPVADGDRLLLCSDGLTRYLDDGEIGTSLATQAPAGTVAETLIRTAIDRGGRDNVTVIVAEAGPADDMQADAAP